ncbi:MAG: hypothetical protein NTV28_05425 [Propionibacteriales bacterium]|nr:hypothetical protein [Propionibacteriales bacterium]
MQTTTSLPTSLVRPAPRPSLLWSAISAVLVGGLTVLDRLLERVGR